MAMTSPHSTPRKMDGGKTLSSSSVGGGREDQSEAIDKFFLALHDKLPKDSRGKLAKLADEVKKLSDANTPAAQTTPPPTPTPFSDQELARRDEETDDARQSSEELNKDVVVVSLSDQPTLRDIVCCVVPRVTPKWYDVGVVLDVQSFVLDGIVHDHRSTDQPRTLFVKWLYKSPGTGSQARTWKSVLEAIGIICGQGTVAEICTAVHIHGYTTRELLQKRRRLSNTDSEELEQQQPVPKKRHLDYVEMKMDLLAQDFSDLRAESDPDTIIKLLYHNVLTFFTKLLEPHLESVKKAACRYHRLGLHQGTVSDMEIGSTDSVDSLLNEMSVTESWYETRFLRKAVGSIPPSAPERGVAEAILSHYNQHLAIYKRATLLKDALAKESESEEEGKAPTEDTKLVPLKITSMKAFDAFTCEDCHRLQARILIKAYDIPEEKVICRDAEKWQSTTVTFLVPVHYMTSITQRCTQLETLWILLEMGIIEVSIPGMFTFSPSVGCFLTLLREKKTFTADLLQVTEFLPYQTYCLIDPDIKEPLTGRTINAKVIEQYWESNAGQIRSDPQGSIPELEDEQSVMVHSDEPVIPLEGAGATATGVHDEKQSMMIYELEEIVKKLEQKVADVLLVNRQQQEEISSLMELLGPSLSTQESVPRQPESKAVTSSHMEDGTETLQATASDLETEDMKHQKKMMQLEESCPINMDEFTKSSASGSMASEHSGLASTTQLKKEDGLDKAVAMSPVVEAAKNGELSTMRRLLDKGVGSAEDQDKEGMTALLWASYSGHLPVVRELVDFYKVNAFHKNKDGRNAMHKAAEGGQLEMIKFLFQTMVHEKDSIGCTMLHWAAEMGHCDVVRYLIKELKMDPQDRDKTGSTALLVASYGGSVEVVRMLLKEFNSSLDEVNNFGNTALLVASYGGRVEVVRMLLVEFNSSLSEKNNYGSTALLVASYNGSAEVVRMLLEEFNCSLDEVNNFGNNALLIASYGGRVEVVRMLLVEFNGSLDTENSVGYTALLLASYGGSVEVVRMLLEEFNNSLDQVNNEGYNALHLAALEGHLELVKYLLPKFGRKKFDVVNNGDTCLTIAIRKQKQDVVDYLRVYGGFGGHQ